MSPQPPTTKPEVWLRGPVPDVLPELQPVAHSLLQVREEIEAAASLSPQQLWARPGGAASIGFHLTHLAGSLDRLLTYARDAPLNAAQRAALAAEAREDTPGQPPDVGAVPGPVQSIQLVQLDQLVRAALDALDRALAQVRAAPLCALDEPRAVGRARLPSTVLGLFVHAAEHAQRHSAQIITTAKILQGSSSVTLTSMSTPSNGWLRDLYGHQTWADAEHWRAIGAHQAAREDPAIRKRLHHIHFVQRAFLWTVGDRKSPFVMGRPEDFASFDELRAYARGYHEQIPPLFAGLSDARLTEPVSIMWFKDPPLTITVAEALTQCAMHSHYHRGQNATRLRELGGEPPMTDLIVWHSKGRPAPAW